MLDRFEQFTAAISAINRCVQKLERDEMEKYGYKPEETVMIGDRLYTDIALGKSFGVCSVLVLSGETQQTDVDAAEEKDKPDFTFPSLKEVDALARAAALKHLRVRSPPPFPKTQ